MFAAARSHTFAGTLACFLFPIGAASAADWIAAPSFYTHSPETGARIDQFQPTPLVAAPLEDLNSRGVYRHYRSSLRTKNFADHFHVVDRSGFDVRPYGEWLFPYRPGAVPYDLWGPQLPAVVGGWGWGGLRPPIGPRPPLGPGWGGVPFRP